MVRRALILAYGLVAYLAFLATLLYTVGFLAGVGVPKAVDDPAPGGPAGVTVPVDLALLSLFALQHSVMARPWFKRWWTRLVAPSIERSTYVLAASLVLALVLWQWRPLPTPLWSVPAGAGRVLLWGLYLAGWVVVVFSTFLTGHFDLFGLRQVVARARQRRYAEPGFREPLLYALVRHPMMVGFFILFWATPVMSVGRLLFVGVASGYILVAVRLEERDLGARLGPAYQRYRQRVPRFVPLPRPRDAARPGPRDAAGRQEPAASEAR